MIQFDDNEEDFFRIKKDDGLSEIDLRFDKLEDSWATTEFDRKLNDPDKTKHFCRDGEYIYRGCSLCIRKQNKRFLKQYIIDHPEEYPKKENEDEIS